MGLLASVLARAGRLAAATAMRRCDVLSSRHHDHRAGRPQAHALAGIPGIPPADIPLFYLHLSILPPLVSIPFSHLDR